MRAHSILTLVFLVLAGSPCFGAHIVGVTRHADLPYASVAGVAPNLLSLDLYTPDLRPPAPAPVVIWIHGGGWQEGDKANQMQYKPALFAQAGYCLASVNYRLSPAPESTDPQRVKYPVHEQDVAAAIAWLSAHVGEYGGDPSRMVVAGHSAGAHLAALVSTDEAFLAAHGLGLKSLRGAVIVDTECFDVPRALGEKPDPFFVNCFGDKPEEWRRASPIFNLSPGKDIPPMLIVKRGGPDRRTQVQAFVDALAKIGAKAETLDARSYTHGDVNQKIGAPGDEVVTPPLMKFLAECFKTTAGPRQP
nr:esterase/lipase [uncultured bacterium]